MSGAVDIKTAVRERYASHAAGGENVASECCSPRASATGSATRAGGCCGTRPTDPASISEQLGYDAEDLAALPQGADLGLGCGNPLAMLELREGETVLDLGSGGGIDCFLASRRVGPSGRVIGVDMTPEMLARARRNAEAGGYENVEFRLGEIENLPVADGEVDAVISNCVINLAPDKSRVFTEAFRALAPGGRLSVSDIVTIGDVPALVRDSAEAYVACLAGAIDRDAYLGLISEAGFEDVRVEDERTFGDLDDALTADLAEEYSRHSGADAEQVRRAAASFASIRVRATKPRD